MKITFDRSDVLGPLAMNNSTFIIGINRFNTPLTKALHFKLLKSGIPKYAIIYLTSDELITDFDIA